ncbi:MAG: class I SAM-dependent methyltransferase [Burkholderiales bacterium]
MEPELSTLTFDDYVMGRTSHEYQRLRLQAKWWEPVTRRILQQAGLRAGMNCLDAGCGPGEVMRLMGETAGAAGRVTGLDCDATIGNEALDVLSHTTPGQFAFLERDIESTDAIPGVPFDLVYARLLLFHLRDPIAVLRKLYRWTKPGGCVVIQDYDLRTVDIYPRLKSWDIFEKATLGVLEKSGKDTRFGHKLPAYFVEAGIGAPDSTDTTAMVGSLKQSGVMYLGVYESLLPRALQLGLVTEEQSQAFLKEIKEAIDGKRYFSALSPLLVSAWKRKAK